MENITEKKTQLVKVQITIDMGSLAPKDTMLVLHLKLREHCGKGGRKIVRTGGSENVFMFLRYNRKATLRIPQQYGYLNKS